MPFPDMAWAILRKWWVFLPVLLIGVFFSRQIQATGAEFVAQARITVVLPRTENTLLASSRGDYKGPTILAVVELYDDSYTQTLRADGLPTTFEFDYKSQYPVVGLRMRGPTAASALAAVEQVADDFIIRLDQVQADRDIIGAARVRGSLTSVIRPSSRPPGSNRALAGLFAGSLMVALGAAYGVDQFLLPARGVRRRDATDPIPSGTTPALEPEGTT